MYFERLERALPDVRARIAAACQRVGRSDADSINVVAITKGHPLEALRAARQVGLSVIGENRVGEAKVKWEAAGNLDLRWHMVGHLQRNKVRDALPMFELIHSVDSLRLARKIDSEAGKQNLEIGILVQVNASGEESKYGFPVEEGLPALREICALERLRVLGLMTMAPLTHDERVLRSTFQRTRKLLELARSRVGEFEGKHLSMGMTNDYEIAVEEGSTMVRLGTVLFGERPND